MSSCSSLNAWRRSALSLRWDKMTASCEGTTWFDTRRLAQPLRRAAPAILFGLRFWMSVCLALYVAFWLELKDASWAAATAAVVCQPQLGASLRKASFRMIGTVVGAVAIVLLTASFPQNRVGFLLGLASWGAACGLVATILRNFAAYSAALAGYTAAILASDIEICIGIASAGIVLALSDLGGARHRLATELAELSSEISCQFVNAFPIAGTDQPKMRSVRRDLFRRVIALDPVIDAAIGEASDLRYRSRILQAAVEGLFTALSAWRTVALHFERLPIAEGRREAAFIRRKFPPELLSPSASGWVSEPTSLRRACSAAARSLTALQAETPSLQLLADGAAKAMLGMARTLNGLTLVVDPVRALQGHGGAHLRVPDWLPAIINALRAFLTVGAVSLFWIATAWPSGALAITFAAIVSILMSPQADQAYSASMVFFVGCCLSAALAAILKLAVFPGIATFPGLCLAMGLVLVPLSSIVALPWQPLLFTAAAVNFIPLLAPANTMVYDARQFSNSALAILVGIGVAALAMRLLPPLTPATRTRRLLALTLRDLRRLAKRPTPGSRDEWESRTYARLLALPPEAEPTQRAQLAAALSVGIRIIRLQNVAPRFVNEAAVDAALNAVACGDSAAAIKHLGQIDRTLSTLPSDKSGTRVSRRVRASVLAISETLTEFASYFDSRALA
jgi:uncharacterized membrane protein YccC